MPNSTPSHATASTAWVLQHWLALRQADERGAAAGLLAEILDGASQADFETLHQLGVRLAKEGKSAEALELLTVASLVEPASARAHGHCGIALHALGRYTDALIRYDRALALEPGYAIALNNRGVTLYDLKRFGEAVESYDRALAANKRYAQAFFNRGNALQALGNTEQALASYDQALAIDPDYAKAHLNRGNALLALKRHQEAVASYERVLALTPESAEALDNRGNALRDSGELKAALESYRKAIAVRPDAPQAHHALIFTLLRTSPDMDEVRAQCRTFAEHFEQRITPLQHRNTALPDRRLRVGYVSADFRDHPVAYHIGPILAHHGSEIEIYCYCNHDYRDAVTERLMRGPDHWRRVADLTDDELAAQVQEDCIDIFVDLSGHTAHNRLLTFARKPAPVQVTWLGLPATTGLTRIDYRLTDDLVDPPGLTERYHSETLVRLSSHACYRPPAPLPAVSALPALSRGYLTFASFNDIGKVTPQTCALWARVLREAPDSRLLFACEPHAGKRIHDRFVALGIDPGRLSCVEKLPVADYLTLHNEIDILLDPFPFNGGTVTRNALWMGVPVITLSGAVSHSRVGLALMTQLGLASFVAASEDDYVRIAIRWSADLAALAEVRRTLRGRM
ncbi:MAG TPA: tetratricopeptide repeat protein, partial [Burkholderiales bacterium]|nr:tetratricopeptide repeat protein [Burkholderiales bacterium]